MTRDVADDVGDRETDSWPRCCRCEPPAFYRRQVFADCIERSDIGAPLQQRIDSGPFVLERQGTGRHRHQGRRAAREQHDEHVARVCLLRNHYCTASCGHTAIIRQRVARRYPLELRGQRDRQVRADDNAITNPIARNPGERVGHERRGLADGNHAHAFAMQARCNRRILDGALDQMVWRRGFDGAAGDGEKVLASVRQRRRLSERSWDRSSPTAPSRR